MFSACCSCDVKDSEETYQTDIEGPFQPYQFYQNEVFIHEQEDEVKKNETAATTVAEKEAIIRAIQTFLETASSWNECQILDHMTGNTQEATYSLNNSYLKIAIDETNQSLASSSSSLSSSSSSLSFKIQLTDCLEIYTWDEMLKVPKLVNFFKLPGISKLEPREQENLIVIEYIDSHQYMQRLCLVLPNITKVPVSCTSVSLNSGKLFAYSVRLMQLQAKNISHSVDLSSTSS